MTTVNDMVRRLDRLKIYSEAKQAVIKTAGDYVELNQEQWKYGQAADGGRIGRYRSKAYAEFKSSQNSLPGKWNVDLILTGQTVESMTLDLNADVLQVEINDTYNLLEKYGDRILGLNEKSRSHYVEVLRPVFIEQIDAKL